MDGLKLDLSGLRDKVSQKLGKENKKPLKKEKKKINQSSREEREKENGLKKEVPIRTNDKKESVSDVLRREALELGATEDDLKLIANVEGDEDSEQEFDGDSNIEKDFGNDLNKFMQDLGLNSTGPVVVDDADVQQEEESIEDEAEEDEAEQEEEEEEEIEKEEINHDKEKPQPIPELPRHERIEPKSIVDTSRLILPPQSDWYNIPIELADEPAPLSQEQIDRLYQRGKEALESDNTTYFEEFGKSSSQKHFLSQMLSGGTLSDKISALTLLIQEAPAHNIKAFDTLLNFTSKKSRNSALQSLNALKDLFINGILPDRKLRYFKNQPLNMLLTKKQLALFYFEDYLKNYYFNIIQVLEKLSHDSIIHVRMNVVGHIFDLLKSKPEQEVNLLKLGVNKIGDIDNKVSAKTSYQILQLEQAHPNMKKIVVDAVIDNTFKVNNDYHAKYYSVLTLNQTILKKREEDVANDLVKTYFALFEKLLIESDSTNKDTAIKGTKENNYAKKRKKNFKKGKKGGKSVKNEKTEQEVLQEKNSKLFSALLTGLNRAFPFSNLPTETYNQHLDTLYKITHSTNFNTAVQALMLVYQITQTQNINPDRYYRTLYESLLDSRLVTSSKQSIYLNLLFKSLKNDPMISRIMAFVKRIVQICFNWINIGSIAGMFFLLLELEKSIPQIRNLFLNSPSDHKYADDDSEEENFKDVDSESEIKETPEPVIKKLQAQYDGRKRDPRFSNAATASLWEINEFLNHYHPTVQAYAQSFVNKEKQVKPDLGLFTLSHFLDRFVYRNAKQKPQVRGTSIMQPLGGAHTGSLLVKASNIVNKEVPVNTENWFTRKIDDIKPDEQFFYQYFTTKGKDPAAIPDDELRDEDFENESDLDDEEVWDALVKSQPEIEGGESDAENLSFSDFDDEDFSDSDDEDQKIEEQENIASQDEQENFNGTDEDSDSEVELQTIGMSDDDDDDEDNEDDGEEIEFENNPQFPDDDSGNDDGDEEAELFKGDLEDEFGSDEEADLEDIKPTKERKRSFQESDDKSNKKKSKKSRLQDLPLFASADDYAQYLESDDEKQFR